MIDPAQIELAKFALSSLSTSIYNENVKVGWYKDPATGRKKQRNIMELLMLIVTEVAEGAEGVRKNLPDNHLPEYPMVIVELADVLIRCFDLAGYLKYLYPNDNYELGNAFASKLLYNDLRLDHKLSERSKPGGKSC